MAEEMQIEAYKYSGKRTEPSTSSLLQLTGPEDTSSKRQKTDASRPDSKTEDRKKSEDYFEKSAYQITVDVNPNYIMSLKATKELGFSRSPDQLKTKVVFIELQPKVMRDAIVDTVTSALTQRFMRNGSFRPRAAKKIIDVVIPLIRDATMNAVYAKLRYIHRLHGEHSSRYNTPPSYNKDVELPLPIAIAIQDLGIIEPRDLEERVLLIPDFPEGTTNEGREATKWSSFDYQCYIPTLKEIGIPFKSVNPNVKVGSAWWTYKVELQEKKLDFVCTLPPLHYTPHSVAVRAIFLAISSKVEEKQIIKLDKLKYDYGSMMRESGLGYNIRAFHALCQAPEEDWNRSMV